jgi:alpha-tubulin suppressor-like RCC1 family protein
MEGVTAASGREAATERGLCGLTRARLAGVAMTVALACLAGSASPVLAARPRISNLKAEPATVDSFGTTTVTASVSGASTCTLAKAGSEAAIYSTNVGLPMTCPCEAGSVEVTGPMPGVKINRRKELVKTPLELTAFSAGGKDVVKQVNVSVREVASGSDVPVEVTGVSTVTQISASNQSSCALLSDGHVECWGENTSGQLGNGTTTSSVIPVEVTGISTATEVSAGGRDACALLSNGHVECWGENYQGQLGDGKGYPEGPESCEEAVTCSTKPVEVTGISSATQITVSGKATCAVLSNGHLECWGAGALGDGKSGGSLLPVEVTGISTATQASAANEDICALLSNGHVQCWGGGDGGALGDGTEENSDVPVQVTGISTATQVSARGGNACAVLANGHAECWGYNYYGQLGNGTTEDSDVPVEVTGISTATQVSAGENTCALLSNGHAECWGDNSYGELGNGTTADSDVPVEVTGISVEVSGISTRQFELELDTCAVLSNGHAECWGGNEQGELGTGGWHDDLLSSSLAGQL